MAHIKHRTACVVSPMDTHVEIMHINVHDTKNANAKTGRSTKNASKLLINLTGIFRSTTGKVADVLSL